MWWWLSVAGPDGAKSPVALPGAQPYPAPELLQRVSTPEFSHARKGLSDWLNTTADEDAGNTSSSTADTSSVENEAEVVIGEKTRRLEEAAAAAKAKRAAKRQQQQQQQEEEEGTGLGGSGSLFGSPFLLRGVKGAGECFHYFMLQCDDWPE